MGGDGVDAKGTGGVPSLGGHAYHRDDGNNRGERGVGITPGGGRNGSRRNPPHKGVH